MDHVWHSLYQWQIIWEERIQEVMDRPDNEHNRAELEELREQLKAIKQAMEIVGQWN